MSNHTAGSQRPPTVRQISLGMNWPLGPAGNINSKLYLFLTKLVQEGVLLHEFGVNAAYRLNPDYKERIDLPEKTSLPMPGSQTDIYWWPAGQRKTVIVEVE